MRCPSSPFYQKGLLLSKSPMISMLLSPMVSIQTWPYSPEAGPWTILISVNGDPVLLVAQPKVSGIILDSLYFSHAMSNPPSVNVSRMPPLLSSSSNTLAQAFIISHLNTAMVSSECSSVGLAHLLSIF